MYKKWVYDIEIFPNFFSVIFMNLNTNSKILDAYEKYDIKNNQEAKTKLLNSIDMYTFVISENENDYYLLLDFMINHKVLIGYNNISYDDLVLDYLLITTNKYNKKLINKKTNNHINKDLYDLSQNIINYGKGYRYFDDTYKYYKSPYRSIDMQKLLYLDKSFISLKQIAVQLKHYRLEDLPLPFDKPIDLNNTFKILDYNFNDVLITYKLYMHELEEVKLRESLSKLYNLPLYSLSKSSIASKLLLKFYSDITGIPPKHFKNLSTHRRVIKFNDIIYNNIKFETPILYEFLKRVKSTVIRPGIDKLKLGVIFNKKKYSIGLGGLHSKDQPNVYISNNKYIYRDADVNFVAS